MSPPRAKELTFESDEQANQTMVLDLETTSTLLKPPDSGEEPTMVLDLTATQVRDLLEDQDF